MDAQVQKVLDDLDIVMKESDDYIAARDAIDVTKDAEIKTLTDQLAAAAAQGAVDATTIQDFKDGVAQAVVKADAAVEKLKVPGSTTGGGDTGGSTVTPLDATFPDNASFVAAVAAYTGPEEVDLDGVPTSKTGTVPPLTYFTQTDGSVSTTPVAA